MPRNFNSNTDNNDEWLTPPEILRALGPFDLDPAAPIVRPWDMAARHYTKIDNGMAQPWEGRVWLNPPYGRETFHWLARLAEHGSGLALIFARTETVGFHAEIWAKARAIFFFRGRLRFHRVTGERGGTANAPSCLVAYSGEDCARLLRAQNEGALSGALIHLR
ncbi:MULTISPECIES: DNA N-6-adenine-methyltransferase [unclassified Desulfovibrio]|uniref:DNA N-6-adenine-methyltransferase n=1 Tax=unclassified Desulfovibrio TaxID=2593640 RepID=UPI0013EA9A95|nr:MULTISPECIES: DNA N-6-adenine-methyltransferase [unclassified Desulfovibrio]